MRERERERGRKAGLLACSIIGRFGADYNNLIFLILFGCSGDYVNDGYVNRIHYSTFRKNSLAPFTDDAIDATDNDAEDEQKADVESTPSTISSSVPAELLNWSGWNDTPIHSLANLPSLTRTSSHGFTVLPESSAYRSEDASMALRVASGTDENEQQQMLQHGLDIDEEEALLHSKLESIATFYNELLTDTLRKQYEYFMDRTESLHDADHRQRTELEPKLQSTIHQLEDEIQQLSTTLTEVDTRNRQLDRAIREWTAKCERLNEENAFIKEINRNLLADQMARKKKQAEQATNAIMASVGGTSDVTSSPTKPSSSSSALSSSSSSSTSLPSRSPSPPLDFAPGLMSKYSNLRDEKSKRISSLEKEVARLMEEIEHRTKKEQAIQQQAEEARKQRINKAIGGSQPNRGKRG